MASVSEVRRQYERWPYPRLPLLGAVPRRDTWQLAADFLFDRSGMGRAPARPRIWIAGCGTLQPYVFRLANPDASIVATDLSARSLAIARRRCDWHGAYGIDFARVDLTDPGQLPDGPFDVIECYGVLMNLEHPGAVLRALASRLAERGVLRVMVYPHYSRRRIFQIQRVATLCGLRFDDAEHPAILRRLIGALDVSHPLRYAFDNYADARNDEGLVDGFLHAGDRGFTGLEFGEMCASAGLRAAFWFHRPWARPDVMAERLGLGHTSQTFVLHYLDLWQELRGNFVACLVRDASAPLTARLRPHPMFARPRGLDPRRYCAWLGGLLAGVGLRSRIDEQGLRLTGADIRALPRLASDPTANPALVERFREFGVLLGGPSEPPSVTPHGGSIQSRPASLPIGDRVPNPFYRHLFDACDLETEQSGGALPDRETQLERWARESDPLEDTTRPFGLTPFGTWRARTDEFEAGLMCTPASTTVRWRDWPLRPELADRVRPMLARAGVPLDRIDAGAIRELWCLLCTHEHLVLDDVFA